MNQQTKSLFKNLNYTVVANILILLVSILLNLIVPKFIGIEEYGYWQLYMFYTAYVGFFHFGWLDGIYLKIGGVEYDDLDKKNLGLQFWYLTIFTFFFSILILIYSVVNESIEYKNTILVGTAIIIAVTNLRTFTSYILQSTNRIKEYALLTKVDRYIYLVGILGYLLLGGKNFSILIIIDIISKLIVTIWGFMLTRDLIFIRVTYKKTIIVEIIDNIKIGSNLMLANIASMLVIGISRLFVEKKWNIEVFGKLSFALGISNIFLTFINAISIVLFPLLRRTDEEKLPELYVNIRRIFVPLSFSFLLFFVPIRIIIGWWLPAYADSLYFMGILFPMVVYEGRGSLLINTYLKTIRAEKTILISNIITLVFATISSSVLVFIIQDINLVVLGIMLSVALRCIIAEEILGRKLGIKVGLDNIIELSLSLLFIFCNLFLSHGLGFVVFTLVFLSYIIINKNHIKESVGYFKKMMK